MKKLVIKNIGQILSGKLEEPIFDGDSIIAIDGKIMEWGAEKDLDCGLWGDANQIYFAIGIGR